MNFFLAFLLLTSSVNSQKIDGFIKSLGSVHTGVHCVNSRTGESVYSYNQDYFFIPASVQKLFTIAGSFVSLGTDFRFSTSILSDSVRNDTVFNIYLRGSGDPSLDLKSLSSIAAEIKNKGITRIEGDIFTYYRDLDTLPLGVGWMWDEGFYSYSAKISALSCCGNFVTVKASLSQGRVSVEVSPKTEFIEFVNLLVPGQDNRYTVDRYFENGKNIIIFSGSLKNPIERTVNLERPDLFTGYLFKNEILKTGISFEGAVTNILTLPALYETLCVNYSQPLSSLTDSILNFSLNLASELLLRKIASLVTPGASSLDGVSYILQRLGEMGLSSSGIVAKDGCGLSRYNLMTPKFITSLLRLMLRHPSLSGLFHNSLPLMGKEGTVSNRLRRISGDRIRAKTGTLTGISSIAGYIVTEGRDTLCFSILMNNFTISQNQIKNIQDSIILELSNY